MPQQVNVPRIPPWGKRDYQVTMPTRQTPVSSQAIPKPEQDRERQEGVPEKPVKGIKGDELITLDSGEVLTASQLEDRVREQQAQANAEYVREINKLQRLGDGSYISKEDYANLSPELQETARQSGLSAVNARIETLNVAAQERQQQELQKLGTQLKDINEWYNSLKPDEQKAYLEAAKNAPKTGDAIQDTIERVNAGVEAANKAVDVKTLQSLNTYIQGLAPEELDVFKKAQASANTGNAWKDIGKAQQAVDTYVKENYTEVPGGQLVKNSDLRTIKADTPDLYQILIEKGYTAYSSEVEKRQTDFQKNNTKLPDGSWVSNEDIEKAAEIPELSMVLKTQGLKAYNNAVDDYNKRAEKSETASKTTGPTVADVLSDYEIYPTLEPGKDTEAVIKGKYKPTGYDLNRAVKEGKISESVLVASFGADAVKEAKDFNATFGQYTNDKGEVDVVKAMADGVPFNEVQKAFNLSEKQMTAYRTATGAAIEQKMGQELGPKAAKIEAQAKASGVPHTGGAQALDAFLKQLSPEQRKAWEQYEGDKGISMTAGLAFAPARALRSDVAIKDISAWEWAVGAGQLATFALPFVRGTAGAVLSTAIGTTFAGDTIANWSKSSGTQKAVGLVGSSLFFIPLLNATVGKGVRLIAAKGSQPLEAITTVKNAASATTDFSKLLKNQPELRTSLTEVAKQQKQYGQTLVKAKELEKYTAVAQREAVAAENRLKALPKSAVTAEAEEIVANKANAAKNLSRQYQAMLVEAEVQGKKLESLSTDLVSDALKAGVKVDPNVTAALQAKIISQLGTLNADKLRQVAQGTAKGSKEWEAYTAWAKEIEEFQDMPKTLRRYTERLVNEIYAPKSGRKIADIESDINRVISEIDAIQSSRTGRPTAADVTDKIVRLRDLEGELAIARSRNLVKLYGDMVRARTAQIEARAALRNAIVTNNPEIEVFRNRLKILDKQVFDLSKEIDGGLKAYERIWGKPFSPRGGRAASTPITKPMPKGGSSIRGSLKGAVEEKAPQVPTDMDITKPHWWDDNGNLHYFTKLPGEIKTSPLPTGPILPFPYIPHNALSSKRKVTVIDPARPSRPVEVPEIEIWWPAPLILPSRGPRVPAPKPLGWLNPQPPIATSAKELNETELKKAAAGKGEKAEKLSSVKIPRGEESKQQVMSTAATVILATPQATEPQTAAQQRTDAEVGTVEETEAEQQTEAATETQAQQATASAVKQGTKTATATKSQTATATKSQTSTKTKQAVRPVTKTQTATKTQGVTKTLEMTETRQATEGMPITAVPSPPIKERPPKQATKLKPKETEQQIRKRISASRGAIAFRQGELNGKDVWHVVLSPYKGQDDYVRVYGRAPTNATIVRGPESAYKTAQLLYGTTITAPIAIDVGLVDANIEPISGKKGIKITYTPGLNTTNPISISKHGSLPKAKGFPLKEKRK